MDRTATRSCSPMPPGRPSRSTITTPSSPTPRSGRSSPGGSASSPCSTGSSTRSPTCSISTSTLPPSASLVDAVAPLRRCSTHGSCCGGRRSSPTSSSSCGSWAGRAYRSTASGSCSGSSAVSSWSRSADRGAPCRGCSSTGRSSSSASPSMTSPAELCCFVDAPIEVTPQAELDKIFGFGQIPTVWLQENFLHAKAHWWDAAASIIYATHFILPFVVAGVLWAKDRVDWRWFATRFLVLCFLGVSPTRSSPRRRRGTPARSARSGRSYGPPDAGGRSFTSTQPRRSSRRASSSATRSRRSPRSMPRGRRSSRRQCGAVSRGRCGGRCSSIPRPWRSRSSTRASTTSSTR